MARVRSTLTLAATITFASACSGPPRSDAGADTNNASDDSIDSIDDAPPRDGAPDVPPLRRVLPPSTHVLSDIVGIASNPGDFPTGADPASTERRHFYYRMIHRLGIHRVRRDFLWRDIEPTQGTFVFDGPDRLVTETESEGIEVLASLLYGNIWATTAANADTFYPPDDPATFANYAARTAERYRGRVHQYEIWNEPNAGFRFWKPNLRGDPRAYGRLLHLAAQAIATADPDARVSFGGTVFLPQLITGGVQFATQAFDANPGLASSLTAYAFHAYTLYAPRVGPESFAPGEVPLLEKIAQTAGMTEHEGVRTDAPFWLTEVGWPSTIDVNETQQANWTVRAIVLAALGGVDAVYLYTMGDDAHPERFPPEDAFGLVHYDADYGDGVDPPVKPVFVAVQTLMETVGAYRVEAREDVRGHADDAFVVRLTDGTHRAWVVWTLEGATGPVMWTAPADGVMRTRVAMDGTRGVVAGGVVMTESPQVVY